MSAANLPIQVEQGATFNKTLTWKAGVPPTPVDLSGCTARMQVRAFASAPLALLDLTSGNGGISLGGVSGQIKLYISAAQTKSLLVSAGVYSLQIVFTDGTVKRLAAGSVDILIDPTHD